MAQYPRAAGAGGPPETRVGSKAAVGLSSHALPPGWADFVFAFHEDEEIGPRMLARIAKRTGLRPDDL